MSLDRWGGVLAVDADQVGPGLVALLFVVGLAVALVFLLRSLNKQLKRIRFEEPGNGPDAADRRPPTDRRRPGDRRPPSREDPNRPTDDS
jgi:hypothetical protein